MRNASRPGIRPAIGTMLVCGAAAALPAGAWAQGAAADAPEGALEEIVVTAQRRSQNLQDVPVAVTALSATAIANANIRSVTDLRVAVPSLNIVNNNGIMSTSLRGVGSTGVNPGFENPVAVYLDGVYLTSTVANFFNLSDVSQVEVLKGPQGTLFGRNATAGLIQITTRTPDGTPTLEARIGYGAYDTIEGRLYAAGGLGEGVAASLSAYGLHMGDGFGRNRTTGADSYRVSRDILVRGKLLVEPAEGTSILLTADYSTVRRNDLAGIALPGTLNVNDLSAGPAPDIGYDQIADSPTFKRGWTAGASLRIAQRIGGLTLTGITAYRSSRYTTAFDYDALPRHFSDIRYTQPERQFTQELQLQPASSGGRFVWVAGLFYINARTAYDPFLFNLYAAGQLLDLVNRQGTESLAGYAQGTYEIARGTNLTLGGRYTTERRRVFDGLMLVTIPAIGATIPVPAADDHATFDRFTFRIAADHRFSDAVLGYASFNRGFKSGGYNTGSPGTPAYRPETIDAYELGLKTDLLGRTLRLNLAGFYNVYRDIQSQNLTMGIISIVNAARARLWRRCRPGGAPVPPVPRLGRAGLGRCALHILSRGADRRSAGRRAFGDRRRQRKPASARRQADAQRRRQLHGAGGRRPCRHQRQYRLQQRLSPGIRQCREAARLRATGRRADLDERGRPLFDRPIRPEPDEPEDPGLLDDAAGGRARLPLRRAAHLWRDRRAEILKARPVRGAACRP